MLAACGGETATPSGQADLTRDDVLTPTEQRGLLDAIDRICGDTWCEGDFDFAFHAFTCQKSERSCDLKLEYVWSQEDGPSVRVPYTCVFEEIATKAQILTEEGGRLTYTDDLYDRITECLSDGEADARQAVREQGGDA